MGHVATLVEPYLTLAKPYLDVVADKAGELRRSVEDGAAELRTRASKRAELTKDRAQGLSTHLRVRADHAVATAREAVGL